jgi:hypothetical protein
MLRRLYVPHPAHLPYLPYLPYLPPQNMNFTAT